MSRITTLFENLKANKQKALIPYITAGDPDPEITVPLMHTLVKSGADILELGIPFSDPMAEGPVIQAAMERALSHKINIHKVLNMVKEFRQQDQQTPVVLMGYLNPIEIMGYEAFAKAANEAGVDCIIIVDLPPEEARDIVKQLKQYNIALIFLVSPTTTNNRLSLISKLANGYLYYVALKGTTGSNNLDPQEVEDHVTRLREFTDLPITVGFGIKNATSAAQISKIADGIVIGSALVSKLAEQQQTLEAIQRQAASFIEPIRQAVDV